MITVEKKSNIEKFFTGRIFLGEDKWLIFSRFAPYDNYDADTIEIKLVDKQLQTVTTLGTFLRGRWNSPNHRNANELWKILKQHSRAAYRIINKLSTPMSEFKPFIIEWNCFKRKFLLQSFKIKRKLINF